jgi:hypothetical protein
MNKETIITIVKHCITRAGYSENEADMFIRQMANLTADDVKKAQIHEAAMKWADTFWKYTDMWGAEGPDCCPVQG